MYNAFINGDGSIEMILKVRFARFCLFSIYIVYQGIPFETIITKHPLPPTARDMEKFQDKNAIFMIKVSLIIIKRHNYLLL